MLFLSLMIIALGLEITAGQTNAMLCGPGLYKVVRSLK